MAEEKLQLRLAVMMHPSFGCYDNGKCALTFTAYISEDSSAMQVISAQDAIEIIEKCRVKDVHDLDGKPCWVETDGLHSILFVKPMVIK